MKKILIIIISVYTLGSLTSCKEDIIPVFDSTEHAVNVWFGDRRNPSDSLVYNYAFRPERPVDSIMFNASAMGVQEGKPYVFTLKAVGGDTARIKEGVHYRFGNYAVGNRQATFPIYILRTKDFADKQLAITFAISNASETKAGAVEYSELKLVVRDRFEKPANWDVDVSPYGRLFNYFGVFSRAKFQFITDITGVPPLYRVRVAGAVASADEIYATQATDYRNTCRTELAIYNATHATPLKDENGIAITF